MSHIEQAAEELTKCYAGLPWFIAVGIDEKNQQLIVYHTQCPPKQTMHTIFGGIPVKWRLTNYPQLVTGTRNETC
jgi:hypothetical protein